MKNLISSLKLKINSAPLSTWFTVFVSLSVLFLVLMNLFAMRPVGWGDFMLTNAGLLLIAPVLVLQNVIGEVWGKKTALKVTLFAILCQIFIVILSEIAIILPTNNKEASSAWANVFGSQWRIVTASITAFAVGSVLNILVFAKIREKSQNKNGNFKWLYLIASFISTVIAQFIDSTLFMLLAFAPVGLPTFELPLKDIFTSIAVGTAVQLLLETTLVLAVAMHLAKYLKSRTTQADIENTNQNI
ncbi:MAG: queuosine precursor transporter [Firmicutes bacterium]|nr:queuosine precursor transporter [Bacillota bacterium]